MKTNLFTKKRVLLMVVLVCSFLGFNSFSNVSAKLNIEGKTSTQSKKPSVYRPG
ncbi:hypothetical protein OIU83_23525 [Flavobacterium sp. LS1R49]|uniref:Uncharacterized protein n=1 Tax=Flavobacterium shii TaxID=2987687 RepID=A0A9X2ZFX0_9FLAO|nr:hypothetical protein [Flavobacterium shii]MCV9930646.1 hypothetical protein [Flavobacterium shii]